MPEVQRHHASVGLCVFVSLLCAGIFACLGFELSMPGKSLLLQVSPLWRVLFGFFFGLFCLPMYALAVWRWQAMGRTLATYCRILASCTLLPTGLLVLSQSPYRDSIFYFYLSKIIVCGLLFPSLLATPHLRRKVTATVKVLLRNSIFVGASLYVIGDSLLWLTTPEIQLNYTPLSHLLCNMAILGGISTFATGATGRRSSGAVTLVVVAATVYIAMFFKIQSMHSPIMAMDLLCFREFAMVAPDFFGGRPCLLICGICVLAATVAALLYFRSERLKWPIRIRCLLVGTLILVWLCLLAPPQLIGNVAWSPLWQWSINGTWVNLIHDIRRATEPVVVPPGYTRDSALSVMVSHPERHDSETLLNRPNIVFLLVESLIDLHDIGISVAPDPQEFLHEARKAHGYSWAVVPNVCGGSSTTEFELLTGMEARMWAVPPVPYYTLKEGNFYSIPRRYGQEQLTATVLHVDEPAMYNRIDAYRKLGINDVEWLSTSKELTRRTDATVDKGELYRIQTDLLLFARISSLIAKSDSPTFVFGFTGGTHAPYAGIPSQWKIRTEGSPELVEIAGYCEEVYALDRMCRDLWTHLQKCSHRTILVIVGDHMPPFKSRVGPYETSSSDPTWMRRVPLLVLDSGGERIPTPELISTNMIPWHILESAGVPLNGSFEQVAIRALDESSIISGNPNLDPDGAIAEYRRVQFGILEDALPIQ